MRGTVAVVTGGGRGIGAAVALAFAGEGATVVVAGRTGGEIEEVAEQARRVGVPALAVPTDVAVPADVTALMQTTLAAHGRVDVLVNAAGMLGPVGPLWEADLQEWRRTLDVNLFGTFLCCRAVLPYMITARSGAIINFSGGGAASPSPRLSAYGASKAAVVRMTETLANEVQPFNIRVNAIAPGLVDTRILDPVLRAGEAAGEHFTRVRRVRETGQGAVPPTLAASLAVWLASDRSGSLSGKLIAAPHDRWERWDKRRIGTLQASDWLTLRRLDRATVQPLLRDADADGA